MLMPAPDHVSRYVSRADFPATREELLRRARDRGAPVDVLAAIERLPDGEYENERALLGTAPGTEREGGAR